LRPWSNVVREAIGAPSRVRPGSNLSGAQRRRFLGFSNGAFFAAFFSRFFVATLVAMSSEPLPCLAILVAGSVRLAFLRILKNRPLCAASVHPRRMPFPGAPLVTKKLGLSA
jgi:hypothetical protein